MNADLVIGPNSSIALKSLSLEQKDSIINISTGSETMTYDQGGTSYAIDIPHQVYNTNTFNTLLLTIQQLFNNTAQYFIGGAGSSFIQGMEYRVAVDEKLNFQFQARKGDLGEQRLHWTLPASIVYDDSSEATNEYYVPGPVGDGNAEVMIVERRMPNGNGYCSVMASVLQYEAKTDPAKSGIWVCATVNDLSNYTPAQLKDLVENDLPEAVAFGVGIQRLNTGDFRYSSISDGVVTSIATRPSAYADHAPQNPVIRLQRSGKNVYASYVDQAGEDSFLIFDDFSTNRDLYQFVIFWNTENYTVAGMVESSLSSFDGVPRVEAMAPEDVDRESANPGDVRTNYRQPRGMLSSPALFYIPDYASTANSFSFENILMAQQFGFSAASFPVTGELQGINFVATGGLKFGPRIVADALIVLSENLPIESYDTTQVGNASAGQQRSILDVVPVPYGNEGIIAYQPTQFTFLDLNNVAPLSVRSLKFRIVDGEYTPLLLNGIASIVFLLKGPDEIS